MTPINVFALAGAQTIEQHNARAIESLFTRLLPRHARTIDAKSLVVAVERRAAAATKEIAPSPD
jgi:hypothetical protein